MNRRIKGLSLLILMMGVLALYFILRYQEWMKQSYFVDSAIAETSEFNEGNNEIVNETQGSLSEYPEEDVTEKLGESINATETIKTNVINVTNVDELIAAIDSIATNAENNLATKTNRYDIHLSPGEYLLYDALDLSRVANGDTLFFRGLEIPDYVNLIGDGDVTINLTIPDADNTEERPLSFWMSTLNVYGENTIKNITIIAKNCKYCVHDDSETLWENRTIRFENCAFIHLGMDTFGLSKIARPFAYGAGWDAGREGYFKNCIVKSMSETGRAFYIHTSAGSDMISQCHAYLDNCVFMAPKNNEAIVLQLPWEIPIDNGGTCVVNNCVFTNSKNVHLFGIKPWALFVEGNTPDLTLINENASVVYLEQN